LEDEVVEFKGEELYIQAAENEILHMVRFTFCYFLKIGKLQKAPISNWRKMKWQNFAAPYAELRLRFT